MLWSRETKEKLVHFFSRWSKWVFESMGDYFKDTHTHTQTHMHAYKIILLSSWMDILPKSIKVKTYAETIGLGNIFNPKKGP
jgi:hypothetical protein